MRDATRKTIWWLDLYGLMRMQGIVPQAILETLNRDPDALDNPQMLADAMVQMREAQARTGVAIAGTALSAMLTATGVGALGGAIVGAITSLIGILIEMFSGAPDKDCPWPTSYYRRGFVGINMPPGDPAHRIYGYGGISLWLHDGLVVYGVGDGPERVGRIFGVTARNTDYGDMCNYHPDGSRIEKGGAEYKARRKRIKQILLWAQDKIPCNQLRGMQSQLEAYDGFMANLESRPSSDPSVQQKLMDSLYAMRAFIMDFPSGHPLEATRKSPFRHPPEYVAFPRVYGSRWYATLYMVQKDLWTFVQFIGVPRSCEILRANGMGEAATRLQEIANGKDFSRDDGYGGTQCFPWGPFTAKLSWNQIRQALALFLAEAETRFAARERSSAAASQRRQAASTYSSVARNIRREEPRSSVGPLLGLAGLGVASYLIFRRR